MPAQAEPPERDFLNLGHHGRPGRSLAVHSQGLELDGRPWLPIMGEFHYSRCPADEWPLELAKLRAGGVTVVASYVIWNHHEPQPGQWQWDGQRDLRRFVQLAHEAGLMVYLRPGPWVHAEVRHGGFPRWLVAGGGPLRCNDPAYLARVQSLYTQVGWQVQGLLWQDGGPVIGLQIENEYGSQGPGCGAEHIAELKRLAVMAGLTVPLYTVTGWPTLDIPAREVLPVSGAYADGFWQGSREPLPPSGVFLFNTRRVIGEMGNVDGTPAQGLIDPARYPFCLAEAGGGMHQSYHRRPVVTADDAYATALVQIGSGANLYGYYMYHGGTNPVCPTGPLNETQATGYPNDVPQWGYDFQAPLGQYGQVRPAWGRLRLLHQLCAAFGDQLAPLPAVLPETGPFDPADRRLPRVALRALGAQGADLHGFLFFNHHVRHHALPPSEPLRLSLKTDAGTALGLPLKQPLHLQPGMAFVWPLGLRLGAARLRHATLQPFTRWQDSDGSEVLVLVALPGVPLEIVLDAEGLATLDHGPLAAEPCAGGTLAHAPALAAPALLIATDAAGRRHRLLLLPQADAERCQHLHWQGRDRLLRSSHPLASLPADGPVLLRAGHQAAELAVWPADELTLPGMSADPAGQAGWAVRHWPADPSAGPWALTPSCLQPPGAPAPLRWGPPVAWRDGPVPLVPDEAHHAQAGRWRLPLPDDLACQPAAGERAWLQLQWHGDVARLWVDGVLVDDRFGDGSPWTIGLHRWLGQGHRPRIEVSILPLDAQLPVFLEPGARIAGAGIAQASLSLERQLRLLAPAPSASESA
ncbi:beta-galactosidase [Aquabacterium sp. OR-4]|uniref:beta-galactosidase n=1 Tax=Aquabacterium sp. OR-4 TaxID=2978127 RepID=UPI0021B250D2|nr:beta-galactosidase [Aquabacterium sp. OR-4]MDT7838484.1 beta-galactosidase [Aquabacterium sp. OR-4]